MADWSGVKSWSVTISETASRPASDDGSRWQSSHSGGGTLKRTGDGVYTGDLSFAVNETIVDHFTIPSHSVTAGSQVWQIELQVGDDGYSLATSAFADDTVPMITTMENTGETMTVGSTVNWRLFDQIQGDFPDEVGAISGTYAATMAKDGCLGSLTWTLSPGVGGGGGGAGNPKPARGGGSGPAPKPLPQPPPKKKHKKPTIPDLLIPLLDGHATDQTAATYRKAANQMGCQRCLIEWLNRWHGVLNKDIPEEAWTELAYLEDKTRRLPEKYFCADHNNEVLEAAVMLKWNLGPAIAGHTGWAVQLPKAYREYYKLLKDTRVQGPWAEGTFYATAHLDDQNWPWPNGNSRLDVVCPRSIKAQLKQDGYWRWRRLEARTGDFENALLTACHVSNTGYSLFFMNCADATQEILTAYGVWLLDISIGILPYDWYFLLNGRDEGLYTIPPAERKKLEAAKAAVADEAGGAVPAVPREPMRSSGLPTAVYRLKGGGALHLERSCPALPKGGNRVQAMALEQFHSPEAVEEEFEGTVCETCMRQMRSEARVLAGALCGGRLVELYADCLSIKTPKGILHPELLEEIPLMDIEGFHRKMFSFGSHLIVDYKIYGVVDKGIARQHDLRFDSEGELAAFMAALEQVRARVG
ncbi:MAG TPA: hypothetical protein VGU46_13005 [Acidobacteriaceae bacterium]|nr:hypothetical protein [Acidobacteriaceae bacterium]